MDRNHWPPSRVFKALSEVTMAIFWACGGALVYALLDHPAPGAPLVLMLGTAELIALLVWAAASRIASALWTREWRAACEVTVPQRWPTASVPPPITEPTNHRGEAL